MDQSKTNVVITQAEKMDYRKDYVSLPKNYGTKKYFNRKDIQAIRNAVFTNLAQLDKEINFSKKIENKMVIIKPNLVGVYKNLGFKPEIAPQSTDPRVLEAVILFLKKYTDNIVIAEASGSGFPTRTSFKIARIDKLAKKLKVKLICLEEQPVERYYLPKANAMKELLIPKLFKKVVEGEAFYISLPKMKTNLYTDVTLGFKNGMGIIPLNLRQRDHNYNLEDKLVDILYLLKPDLTIIDGIIGAQGQCPAVALPIDSHVIISGNNSVETDSVATKMMGMNPDKVKLLVNARERGFGDTNVKVHGKIKNLKFQKADPSLMNKGFYEKFPGVQILMGHQKESSPKIDDITKVTNKVMQEMELSCRGGCLVTMRMGLEMIKAEENSDFDATIILGTGVKVDGKEIYYFDKDGKSYTFEDIKNINRKTLALGKCTRNINDIVDYHIDGCLFHPGLGHIYFHKINNSKCKMTSFKNKHLIPFIFDTLKMRRIRRRILRKRQHIDISMTEIDIRRQPEKISAADKKKDYIKWEFPPMSRKLSKRLRKEEWKSLMILF